MEVPLPNVPGLNELLTGFLYMGRGLNTVIWWLANLVLGMFGMSIPIQLVGFVNIIVWGALIYYALSWTKHSVKYVFIIVATILIVGILSSVFYPPSAGSQNTSNITCGPGTVSVNGTCELESNLNQILTFISKIAGQCQSGCVAYNETHCSCPQYVPKS